MIKKIILIYLMFFSSTINGQAPCIINETDKMIVPFINDDLIFELNFISQFCKLDSNYLNFIKSRKLQTNNCELEKLENFIPFKNVNLSGYLECSLHKKYESNLYDLGKLNITNEIIIKFILLDAKSNELPNFHNLILFAFTYNRDSLLYFTNIHSQFYSDIGQYHSNGHFPPPKESNYFYQLLEIKNNTMKIVSNLIEDKYHFKGLPQDAYYNLEFSTTGAIKINNNNRIEK
jgi:hypothetical protein